MRANVKSDLINLTHERAVAAEREGRDKLWRYLLVTLGNLCFGYSTLSPTQLLGHFDYSLSNAR